MQESRGCAKHRIVAAGDQEGLGGLASPHAAAGKPGAGKSLCPGVQGQLH